MTIEAAAWDHCSLLQVAKVIIDTDRHKLSRVPATMQYIFVQDLILLLDSDKHRTSTTIKLDTRSHSYAGF